ncbi:hypothetical protein Tco_1101377, partial [Tanacetum coccineum]
SKVTDTKDTIIFKLDTQEIMYTVDMFLDTLKLPVETPTNPLIAPVNIEIIESFMNKKKDVIQYPRFTKLIIADLMKKYPSISLRLEEDYHFIKDDISLVSVYTMGNVIVRGTHMTTPRAHRTPTLTAASPQEKKKKKQNAGETKKKDDEMGSLDIRIEKMQTPIPTPPRSPRINLSSDRIIVQELMYIVSVTPRQG